MITKKALEKTLQKLHRLSDMLYERLFTPVDTVETRFYPSAKPLHQVPDLSVFGPLPKDRRWGVEGQYGWFRGSYQVPEHLAGKDLYLYPHIEGYEALLFVDGRAHSNYAAKEILGSHGNHYANRFAASAKAGETFDLALEYYAFHDMPGTAPFTEEARADYTYPIGPVQVCLRDELLLAYWADLSTLLTLIEVLPEDSFRRADVLHTLYEVHKQVYYDADNAPAGAFRESLEATHPLLQNQLAKHNGSTAPFVGLVGHSHMDTAWLWPISETVKKCARTYANQLTLMDQYPEYRFVQSSSYHLEMMRLHYPELFARIQNAIATGRYEPNGGAWVECDCNITGSEYLARQFLWGQRYTQEHFGYRSDTFWLPDTFGYSYAIPQVMKLCGIDYFLTTKMSWNDTNHFPYTTFYWQGLDGTRVLTHLNRTHLGPDPKTLNQITYGGDWLDDPIQEKTSSYMRLFSYGKGDGGGGPEFEMIESARRLGDLEGIARSGHVSVSGFMQDLEKTSHDLSIYAGEMYLELHRGTLTNQHTIKRNNRKAEVALHDLEQMTVRTAVQQGLPADGASIRPLLNTLLVNQFHDILPGTCIQSVHEQCHREVSEVLSEAQKQTVALATGTPDEDAVTLHNTLGFARCDTLYLPYRAGKRIAGGFPQQVVASPDGEALLAVAGVTIPALSSLTLQWEAGDIPAAPSAFERAGERITTPFAILRLGGQGGIESFVDRRNQRELRHPQGRALNTFLMAEDVPASWDNWDIDADLMEKFTPQATLLSREIVADGPVELRLRSQYRLSDRSTLEQDMVCSAFSPTVVFETRMNWQEEHRFLKTAFDTSLVADGARHEIQFGHIRRSNHRSTDVEKAAFEVCNHKYTDLSESNYGVALLNDCKYGISVEEGRLWLSLHKGGMRPDRSGDKGAHECRYAFSPHIGGFGPAEVVQPAYAMNYAPVVTPGRAANTEALLSLDVPGVVIETIKPCEETQHAYIVRLYEATGGYARVGLSFGHPVQKLTLTNILEEALEELTEPILSFGPFEIKTLRVEYEGKM